jgi:hypothetical protein
LTAAADFRGVKGAFKDGPLGELLAEELFPDWSVEEEARLKEALRLRLGPSDVPVMSEEDWAQLAEKFPKRCVNELKGVVKRLMVGDLRSGWLRRETVVTISEVEEVRREASLGRWGAAALVVPNATTSELRKIVAKKVQLFPREARRAVRDALDEGGVDAVEAVSREFPGLERVAIANEVGRQRLSGRSPREDEALCEAMRTGSETMSKGDLARWKVMAPFAVVTGLLDDALIDLIVERAWKNWDEVAKAVCREYPGVIATGRDVAARYEALSAGGDVRTSVKKEAKMLEEGQSVSWVEAGLKAGVSPVLLAMHSYREVEASSATWRAEDLIQLRDSVVDGAIRWELFPGKTRRECRALYQRVQYMPDEAILALAAWQRRPREKSKMRCPMARWEPEETQRLVKAVKEKGPAWKTLSVNFPGRKPESLRMRMRGVTQEAADKFSAIDDRAIVKTVVREGEGNVDWAELAAAISAKRPAKEAVSSWEVLARWLAIRAGEEVLRNVLVEQIALKPDKRPDVTRVPVFSRGIRELIDELAKTTDEEELGWRAYWDEQLKILVNEDPAAPNWTQIAFELEILPLDACRRWLVLGGRIAE